jgi:predicted RNA-binding protein with PUA-like domain
MPKTYWLMKSEPDVYSFEDLKRDGTTYWEGVRNYQARNFLRDAIKEGDGVLFYHSRHKPMCIMGTALVKKEGYPDTTQFDPKSLYFDAKSQADAPRWFRVDICYEESFKRPVTLDELKEIKGLEEMVLLNRSRLSVQPVRPKEWGIITRLGGL